MIRTFGVQTLGTPSQPWFADVTTAAIVAQPQNANDNQTQTPVLVGSTTRYRVGDYFILDAGAANQERVNVAAITSSTILQVTNCAKAHASSAVIALDIFCFNVTIQLLDGGSGLAVLGTDKTVTATPGGTAFYELTKVASAAQPNVWAYSPNAAVDNLKTSDGWIIGTSGDKYIAAAYVV